MIAEGCQKAWRLGCEEALKVGRLEAGKIREKG